jgi:hypothetical protein
MSPNMEKIVKAAGNNWTHYEDNEWNGSDRLLPDGGTLRLAREGGDGEPVEMFRLDKSMMLEWQASFSSETPATVVAAALNTAVAEGGE